jgi:transposase
MQDHRPSTDAMPGYSATLFVVLDLSRLSWLTVAHAPHADKVSRHKLPPGAEGVLTLVGRVREQAERVLCVPVQVVSCNEAAGVWLHRVMQEAGIEDQVVAPTTLLVDRRSRRAKTDRLGAGRLTWKENAP